MAVTEQETWQRSMASEARAAPEFAAFLTVAGPLLARSPRGDGHTVIVLPGLGGGDTSTRPLRWFLDRLGYRTQGWGLGMNQGFGSHVTSGLDDALDRALRSGSGPISLVGWSLGGLHALALAARRPSGVRSLITLGSPLARWRRPPQGIPMTSVYSRSDAIVPWTSSILPPGRQHENVEVRGSHLGLGHNPAVLIVVADRLAQRSQTWRPFEAPRWARRWVPVPGAG